MALFAFTKNQKLLESAASGYVWEVEKLLDKGADAMHKDAAAIRACAAKGYVKTLGLLLGAKSFAADKLDREALVKIIAETKYTGDRFLGVVNAFTARGVDLLSDESIKTALLDHAAAKGDVALVERMVAAGARSVRYANTEDVLCHTLVNAVYLLHKGDVPKAAKLLGDAAKTQEGQKAVKKAFDLAAAFDDTPADTMETLLALGAKPEAEKLKDILNKKCRHAERIGRREEVKKFRALGADDATGNAEQSRLAAALKLKK